MLPTTVKRIRKSQYVVSVVGFLVVVVLAAVFILATVKSPPSERVVGGFLKPFAVPHLDDLHAQESQAYHHTRSLLSQQLHQIRAAFVHAMEGYNRWALGHDEIRPCTNRTNDSWGGFGVVPFDGLDTCLLMQMSSSSSFSCTPWLQQMERASFLRDWDAHVFEYTIRYMGGLVSAKHLLSSDSSFSSTSSLLSRALQLGHGLLPAFHTPHHIPRGIVNLETGISRTAPWLHGTAVLAEAGSIQLEMIALSRWSQQPVFEQTSRRAMRALLDRQKDQPDGLFPLFLDIDSGEWKEPRSVSTGALGDSFYEMLVKLYIWNTKRKTNFGEKKSKEETEETLLLLQAWKKAWKGIKSTLLMKSNRGHFFFGEIKDGHVERTMGHLSCHMPAVLALAHVHIADDAEYLDVAKKILDTCWMLYKNTATGIGPETVRFHEEKNVEEYEVVDPKYILRPELIESLFYFYRITGDAQYRNKAYAIFESLQKHCKVESGYSGLNDVNQPSRGHNDSQQSFFFAETLKYLYLIFSEPSVVPLSKYIFTTEGHLIPLHDD